MKLAIFDIDNCLAQSHWREQYIKGDSKGTINWDNFHQLSGLDEVSPITQKKYAELLIDGYRVVFSTSRPAKWRLLTHHWLRRKLDIADHPAIYMRDDDDMRQAEKVKNASLCRIYEYYATLKTDTVIAFDDHPEVITMYRNNDIEAFHWDVNGLIASSLQPQLAGLHKYD